MGKITLCKLGKTRSATIKKNKEIRTMVEQSYYEKADAIIEEHGAKPSALIPIIQDIQSEYLRGQFPAG